MRHVFIDISGRLADTLFKITAIIGAVIVVQYIDVAESKREAEILERVERMETGSLIHQHFIYPNDGPDGSGIPIPPDGSGQPKMKPLNVDSLHIEKYSSHEK